MQPESRNTLTFISVVGTKFFIRPCFLNHWTLEKICLFFLGTLFISFLVFHVTYEVWGLHTWEEVINYISRWIKANKSNKTYPVFGKQHLPCIYENLHAQKRLPWYLLDPQPGCGTSSFCHCFFAIKWEELCFFNSVASWFIRGNKWKHFRKSSCFWGFLFL